MISVIGVGDNTVDRYLHLEKCSLVATRSMCRFRLTDWAIRLHTSVGWQKTRLENWSMTPLNEEGVDISHCRLVEGQNAFCEITTERWRPCFWRIQRRRLQPN